VKTHVLQVKIYYEDTDCGGVVYYANYLRYFEWARTELLEAEGLSLKSLMDEGTYFVVAEANLKYRSPARYGDVLAVETRVDKTGPASIIFSHRVLRGDPAELLVEGTVRLGSVGRDMRPVRLTPQVVDAVAAYQ
jgi:acyl-CoA thioester hydrolase